MIKSRDVDYVFYVPDNNDTVFLIDNAHFLDGLLLLSYCILVHRNFIIQECYEFIIFYWCGNLVYQGEMIISNFPLLMSIKSSKIYRCNELE